MTTYRITQHGNLFALVNDLGVTVATRAHHWELVGYADRMGLNLCDADKGLIDGEGALA